MTRDVQWACTENEVTLRRGFGRLKVEVRTPLNPDDGPPDAVISMHVEGRREAYYMVIDTATWDDLAMRLEDLRYHLEDRRPIATCARKRQPGEPRTLEDIEGFLRRTYEPALTEQINNMHAIVHGYPFHTPKLTRWQRFKAWWVGTGTDKCGPG